MPVLSIPFLFKGAIIGLSIAVPIGPVSVLCLRHTAAEGKRMGFISGLGAATADALYAIAGVLVLAAIAQWIIDDRRVLMLLGGLFLVYLGGRTFLSKPAAAFVTLRLRMSIPPGARGVFLSTLLVTLANPVAILSFAAVFAGLAVPAVGLAPGRDEAAALIVVGVFLGSALWWWLLSAIIGRLDPQKGPRAMQAAGWACGTALTAFGLYAVALSALQL